MMRRNRAVQCATMVALCTIAGGAAQLGCASIFGLDKTIEREERLEGGPPADASSDASDAGAGRFVLQSTRGCVAGDGTYRKIPGYELWPTDFDILVRNADGEFQGPFQGEPARTPTAFELRFEGLPSGERYLRQNAERHYITQGDRLVMTQDHICRPDALPAPKGSRLQLSATGLLDAETTDTLVGSVGTSAGTLSKGSPSWTIDYVDDGPLLDKTRGDVVWVMRDQNKGSAGYAPLQVCHFPDGYRMNGGESVVSVVCGPPEPQTRLAARMSKRDFEDATPPGARIEREPVLSMRIVPGDGSYEPDGIEVRSIAVTTTRPEVVNVDFWNPLPQTWSAVAEVSLAARRDIVLQDGTTRDVAVEVQSSFLVSGTSLDIQPLVAAPSQVTVGGKDVLHSGFVQGVGLRPRIVVTPKVLPGRPIPNKYDFFLRVSGGRHWMRFITRAPELTLPENTLAQDDVYELQVSAHYVANSEVEETERNGYPHGMASITSNAFTP